MTTAPTIRLKLTKTGVIHCGGNNYAVTAVAVHGGKFTLLHNFPSRAAAEAMAAKVLAKGSLDERHWELTGVVDNTVAASVIDARVSAEQARIAAAQAERWAA